MSGRTFSFEINRTTSAPAATLFRLETDGGRWSEWAKPIVVQSSWERQGDPAPGGPGAVRKVGLWPLLMREKTLEYEQDRRHVYTLIGPPSPAKDYRGEVLLTPNAAGGTDVRWTGSFTERLRGTGPVMLVFLRGAVQLILGRLVKAAERE
jgi:hypothetical protein